MGLSSDMLNESMMYKGEEHIILGYNTRARKNPIEFTKDGRNFKCGIEHMKRFVKATRPEFFL